MDWEQGRQGTGYLKAKLLSGSWFDCYLIKYPPHTDIPPHTDPVPGHKHFRLNIVLKGHGKFDSDEPCMVNLWNRLILFRPDINRHSVQNGNTERLVLSFGWITKEKDA